MYNDLDLDYSFKSNKDIDEQGSTARALEPIAHLDVTLEGTFDTLEESKTAMNDSRELNLQLEQMIEKYKGFCKCNVR